MRHSTQAAENITYAVTRSMGHRTETTACQPDCLLIQAAGGSVLWSSFAIRQGGGKQPHGVEKMPIEERVRVGGTVSLYGVIERANGGGKPKPLGRV